jgi:hypothetical protein
MQMLCASRGIARARGSGGDRAARVGEICHVVIDEPQFQHPFSMETALNKSACAGGTQPSRTKHLPTDGPIALFHTWMRRHRIGRKRVLDTLLAATYRAADVTSLLKLNATDFKVFDELACVPISALRYL